MVADVTEATELANNQAALNECFAMIFQPGANDVLPEIVGIMCRRLEAARGYLIRFDFAGKRFVPAAEYLGVSGELKPVEGQEFSINNNLYKVLTSDGIVMAPDVNDPESIEKLGLWKEENERCGIKSLYCALVSVNGSPWGYIGVTYENDYRQISEYEKNFILSGARLAGLMIERRLAVEQQQATIAELRNHKALMEYGAALTRSGVFRYDLSDNSISGSNGLEELFAVEAGKALPPERWICQEDLSETMRQLDSIYSGDRDQITFNFRSDYFGERRNYRMLFTRDVNNPGAIFFGAIQDITEITLQSEKLRETMSLWNLVLDLIPVMIFAKREDDNFRYTLANRAFVTFAGKTLEHIIGHTDAEIFDRPDDYEWFDECDRAVMGENKTKSFVENVAGSDGVVHSIRTTKMPFTDASGRRLLLATCMDVTELNALIANLNVLNACLEIFFRSENSSEALAALLKNIAEHMKADYVYVLKLDLKRALADTVMDYAVEPMVPFLRDLKSAPLDVNDISIKYLRDYSECFLNDVREPEQRKILTAWEPFYGKYDMRSLYFSGIRQDGEIWGDLGVVYTGTPYQMSDLDRQFLRSAAHLIELFLERERSADKLRSALTQAQAAERAKSMFLASMSHEIRTPLNAVIGFSELLKAGTPTPQEQQEYLDGIFSSGNSLLELINDVLDLSKLEAGQMQLILEKVDFEALLNDVASIFRIKCAERQIYIRVECNQKLPDLWLDKLRLRQILFNLIGNAVKFTEHGGVRIMVNFVASGKTEGELTLHVIDTGCGIPEHEQKQLFQIFVQASSARNNAAVTGSGSGLGLAICRRLIEQMKGKIELRSQVGVGSDFVVTLPNIRFEVKDTVKKVEPVVREKVAFHGHYRALIVDDVSMNLKVMGAMLKKLGVNTVSASGGVEALAALERENFDFVLTDMWMPEMNGAELVKQIRAQKKFASLPIYAVTADIEAQENFPVELFSGILLKPISIEKFQHLLNELA